MTGERVDVAIVGAGPAGTTLAADLARRGIAVTIFERAPSWHWRAGGVFSSPAAVVALERGGLGRPVIDAVARPIPAMRLETPGGAIVRLTYGAEAGGPPAVGFDRSGLDPALETLATRSGAEIRRGVAVTGVELADPDGPTLAIRTDDDVATIRCRIVVGADGAHSIVARAAGVARPTRLAGRVGLTYHVADGRPAIATEARLRVIDGGYVGLAPVPRGRSNVGIVLGPAWGDRLHHDGAAATVAAALHDVPPTPDDPTDWSGAVPLDRIEGAAPLGGRATRPAGRGWFLVGDAVGFLDPFTGEGLHRALVSSELAAGAIAAALATGRSGDDAAAAYARAMRRRFAAKDAVSCLVQSFLARPVLFEYAARRLATRASVRATMGLVMGDLVPAHRGLDPRFLVALLAP